MRIWADLDRADRIGAALIYDGSCFQSGSVMVVLHLERASKVAQTLGVAVS